MAGGTWLFQNKVRPGVYINVRSKPRPLGVPSDRGIVALPLVLSWGPEKTIVHFDREDDSRPIFGYDLVGNELLLLREAIKRARTALVYRLNTGEKASATIGVVNALSVTAKYSGVRGNDIAVTVRANIEDDTKYDVITYLEGRIVDSQMVSVIEDLVENDYVKFSGNGTPETALGVKLSGGTDGEATVSDYVDAFDAFAKDYWHTMALPVSDTQLKAAAVSYIRRLREDEGVKVQAVLAGYPLADYEGIISVKNSVVLSDGTSLTTEQATAWVAGATAGAAANESLTYTAYDDAVDVVGALSDADTIKALQNGEFVFTKTKDGRVIVEQDINTFRSFTPDKGKDFRKNRVIRVLDTFAVDAKDIFERYYIGKVPNNDRGRSLFKAEVVSYLRQLEAVEAVRDVVADDIDVQPGMENDAVLLNARVRPVDAVEKIYVTVVI
ncbi:MAG: phage tail sheath family protein [Candidatus Carbobacillus sp.]|nr:phage tail sheath family protein [Candidatus Carbobacillus sp.]